MSSSVTFWPNIQLYTPISCQRLTKRPLFLFQHLFHRLHQARFACSPTELLAYANRWVIVCRIRAVFSDGMTRLYGAQPTRQSCTFAVENQRRLRRKVRKMGNLNVHLLRLFTFYSFFN